MANIKRANTSGVTKSGVAIADVPDAPSIGTASASGLTASVPFTAATTGGIATTFTATSNPGSITGTASSSPISVSGLTEGTSYTFTVFGTNSTASGPVSSASNSITPVDPVVAGYDLLASTTLSTATSSITFAGIPSGYKHLQIRLFAKAAPTATDAGYDLLTRFNGDTNIGNYGTHYVGGNGSGTFQGYTGNLGILGTASGSSSTSVYAANIIDILDYSNTNKYTVARNLVGFDTNGGGQVALQSFLWRNTVAITSIEFVFRTGPSFAQYSTAALYGVK